MMRRLGHSYAQAARAVGCLALVVLLLSGCSPFAPSGPPWIEMHPKSHPTTRAQVRQSAYDAVTKQVVLYSETDYGTGESNVNNPNFIQTSLWNGRDWTDLHPAVQPPHQPGVAMAYNAATKSIVLVAPEVTMLNIPHADILMARAKARQSPHPSHAYQAFIRHLLGITETWIWNGATWTELHPSTSPPPPPAWVPGQYMAYDAATRSVVYLVPVARRGLETWTWNGITWTQQHPSSSPQSRFMFAMAYDPQVREVLVFGGLVQAVNAPVLGYSWAWNGKNWIRLHPPVSPPARYGASMAYDPQVHELVLFGGTGQTPPTSGSFQFFDDTWAWNARTWRELHPSASPPPLMVATISYDAATKSIVLFGGYGAHQYYYDTWTLKLGMTSPRHRASEPVKAHARAATTHR